MLQQVWAAIAAGRSAEARALLEADAALLASDDGQVALGYALAHVGQFDEAREVYARLRTAHVGQSAEHIFLHQQGVVERLAGDHRAALKLFVQERALIDALSGDRALERAVNGYEIGVNLLTLNEAAAAATALAAALADAQAAADPMTLGCVGRALGDFAAQAGNLLAAQDEYDRAHTAFLRAGDERAAAEVRARLATP